MTSHHTNLRNPGIFTQPSRASARRPFVDARGAFTRTLRLASLLVCAVSLAALAPTRVLASTAYGDLNNFDVFNDTGQECHGFEIELDDIHSTDITYTYDWNHYGPPTITEDNSNVAHPKVFVRYAAKFTGTYSAFTAMPATAPSPTNGHMCTNPSVNFGCEHFGVGYYGSPSLVKYNWLVDDPLLPGSLIHGPAVNVATPSWTYFPPAAGQPIAQVQAVILAPPPPPAPVYEFGDAVWVKSIVTTSHNAAAVALKDLVSDDPDDPADKNWRNGEPDEVEVEWRILQTEFSNPNGANNDLVGANEGLPNGDEVVTRRYEFYKYTGFLDPETNEALCDNYPQISDPADPKYKPECDPATGSVLGDYIGAQMAGFNVEAVLGLIDHVQDADINSPYTARTLVVGGNTPYVTQITAGSLPADMSLDSATGILSGTPSTAGSFTFTVTTTDADLVQATKSYTLKVVGFGGLCEGVVCTPSDSCHDAGLCDVDTGVCSNPVKPDTSPCDDGNLCTTGDSCTSGLCSGTDTSAIDCNDGNLCTTDTCDPGTGCANVANSDPCDDSDACTDNDLCQAGVCSGSLSVVCTASDQCHAVGICDPASGLCSNPSVVDGTACNDGNACTIQDACVGGICVANPNHCGDSTLQAACGEQCDDGGTLAGGGCDATCQLESMGRACLRTIGSESRKLAGKELSFIQGCLDGIANNKLGCVSNQCVVNPLSSSPSVVAGSSCAEASDCCPEFDSVKAGKTSEDKLSALAEKAAGSILSECSISYGADNVKGTSDDTYVTPQSLGFGTTCADVFGECTHIGTTTLTSPGDDNDLLDCMKCTARALATETLGFSYPLAATSQAESDCQSAIGISARKAGIKELSLFQQCQDRVAKGGIACQSGQCVLNPISTNPLTVSGSHCAADGDCCPGFDALDPAKTTSAKIADYAAKGQTAIKKACSTAVGPDNKKGTDDDTFLTPAAVGFGSSCLDSFGHCSSLSTATMVTSGPDNDLVECITCAMSNSTEHFASLFGPQHP